MEGNKILDSGHYDCTCTKPKPTYLFENVRTCLNCYKPISDQFTPKLGVGMMDELVFFSKQWNCQHEYIVQDQDWKSCTKCGNIKPTRDFR